jgi:hypothetical protein
MIKLKTIYRTKNGDYIVVIRNPKAKWYEFHASNLRSEIEDFNYLLKEYTPFHIFHSLADIRYFARKVIDGEKNYYV